MCNIISPERGCWEDVSYMDLIEARAGEREQGSLLLLVHLVSAIIPVLHRLSAKHPPLAIGRYCLNPGT